MAMKKARCSSGSLTTQQKTKEMMANSRGMMRPISWRRVPRFVRVRMSMGRNPGRSMRGNSMTIMRCIGILMLSSGVFRRSKVISIPARVRAAHIHVKRTMKRRRGATQAGRGSGRGSCGEVLLCGTEREKGGVFNPGLPALACPGFTVACGRGDG